jgi:hypothetical protein
LGCGAGAVAVGGEGCGATGRLATVEPPPPEAPLPPAPRLGVLLLESPPALDTGLLAGGLPYPELGVVRTLLAFGCDACRGAATTTGAAGAEDTDVARGGGVAIPGFGLTFSEGGDWSGATGRTLAPVALVSSEVEARVGAGPRVLVAAPRANATPKARAGSPKATISHRRAGSAKRLIGGPTHSILEPSNLLPGTTDRNSTQPPIRCPRLPAPHHTRGRALAKPRT